MLGESQSVTFPCHLRESVPDSFRDRRKAPETPETPHKTARTYPRRYTYDTAGRMKTMRTKPALDDNGHGHGRGASVGDISLPSARIGA